MHRINKPPATLSNRRRKIRLCLLLGTQDSFKMESVFYIQVSLTPGVHAYNFPPAPGVHTSKLPYRSRSPRVKTSLPTPGVHASKHHYPPQESTRLNFPTCSCSTCIKTSLSALGVHASKLPYRSRSPCV